ncbi:MAG: T9SS type A sorting domain-containing protein [candidate division WOR-3 bacterium]
MYNLKKWVVRVFCGITILFILQNLYAENGNPMQSIGVPSNLSEIIKKVSREIKEGEIKIGRTHDNLKTGEFLIDTNVIYMPAPNNQTYPSVAFDGTNYLVVWTDSHSGSYCDIYGARVSPDGTVLDPNGIAISTATNSQYSPSVAFDGTNYFVVWTDSRSGSSYDIYGARVSTDGTVLDPNGIAISTATSDQSSPSVAFDGTNYLVVWHDYRNGTYSDIYGARVSTGGTVLDPNGIAISTAADDQYYPSVAFDGTNYFVVWQDYRSGNWDIYGARVSRIGTVLDQNGIAISTATSNQRYPSVAFDGTNYFVVWQDYRSGNWDIYGARVNRIGTVLDPNGIAISTATNSREYPSVAFDGTNYFVVWHDSRSDPFYDIYGARVSPDGTVLDQNGIAISTATGGQGLPSVAFDGTNYLVVWTDYRSGTYSDIYGARVNQNGTVLDPNGIAISITTHSQYYPSVAFDGTNYFVVWEDTRNNSYDIYGARVSPDGTVLDPTGIAISTATNHQIYPSVAFDGTNYLVVWTDYRSGSSYDIYGARVNKNGTVLDPNGIAISTATSGQGLPSVAFDGTNYFVVWEDYRNGTYSDIYGARVTKNGTVLDQNGIAISTATSNQRYPSVAFDGTNYFVVWHDYRNGSWDIYGARVNQNGTVLDLNGIAISTATGYQTYPSVAFDGANYFVVWQDYRSGSSYDIYGARVSTDGAVLDLNGIAISTATGYQYSPSVAFDGTNYLVVWDDGRSGSYDIYGAKVSPDGNVIEEFPVSTQPGTQTSPALARGSGNQILITYFGYVGYINNHPVNAMRIWGKFYPFVKIEEKINIPKEFISLYIQPNPFNSFTKIRYYLPKSSNVMLKLYDVKGGCLKTFVNGKQDAGIYEIKWDRKNERDKKILQGIYFLRLETDYCTVTRKVVIMP